MNSLTELSTIATLPLATTDGFGTYAVSRISEILTVLIVFGAGVSIPICALYFQQRSKRELLKAWHDQRMAAIEKGIELPSLPDALLNGSRHAESGAPARRIEWARIFSSLALFGGLICVFLGIGLRFAYYPSAEELAKSQQSLGGVLNLSADSRLAFDRISRSLSLSHSGSVIALVGIGLLVYSFLTRKQRAVP